MTARKAGIISLVLFTVVAILHALDWNDLINLPDIVLQVSQWLFAASLVLYSILKKSLTSWIMTSMFIGIIIGHDFPAFSQDLKFLRQIFLNLIKAIVAPLLFSTLVVGIAGHSDLKQVGRLGWKSLLYFEIVTTLALIIGLICINISGAGHGIVKPR